MRGDNMAKQNERIQNVVHMLSSIGVKVKKNKITIGYYAITTQCKTCNRETEIAF